MIKESALKIRWTGEIVPRRDMDEGSNQENERGKMLYVTDRDWKWFKKSS